MSAQNKIQNKSLRRIERQSTPPYDYCSGPDPKPWILKVCACLARLTMAQLNRRRHQYTVRAAGASRLLADIQPGSRLRNRLETVRRANLAALAALQKELDNRWMAAYPYRNQP